MIKVRVPATTANLGPGFDTLGLSLDLYNQIEVEEIEEGLEIEVVGYGKNELPINEDNLLYKAMVRVFEATTYYPQGIKLRLINRIPLARGLGSSAAAIVGGLVSANRLVGDILTKEELLHLAVEIEGHPDNVAPALLGGIVLSTIKDGDVSYKKIDPPKIKAVLCIPDYQLSTAKAREILPEKVSFDDALFNISHTGLLVAGFLTNDYQLISQGLDDRLHQPYRQKLIPGLTELLKDELLQELALGITLSGAGPTIVTFTLKEEEKIGQRMVELFSKEGIKSDYLITDLTGMGVEFLGDKLC